MGNFNPCAFPYTKPIYDGITSYSLKTTCHVKRYKLGIRHYTLTSDFIFVDMDNPNHVSPNDSIHHFSMTVLCLIQRHICFLVWLNVRIFCWMSDLWGPMVLYHVLTSSPTVRRRGHNSHSNISAAEFEDVAVSCGQYWALFSNGYTNDSCNVAYVP